MGALNYDLRAKQGYIDFGNGPIPYTKVEAATAAYWKDPAQFGPKEPVWPENPYPNGPVKTADGYEY